MKRLTLEEMQRRAEKSGGKCLSTTYINSTTKMEWECEKGHSWWAMPSDISQGHWCPTCGAERRGLLRRRTIEEMHALADSKGGKCLSKEYVGNKIPLEWECSTGHRWKACADRIVQGSWCPECSQGVSERICRKLFEAIFSKQFRTKKPTWLVNSRGNRMELDGYCKDLELAFEYHGIQHYKKSRVHKMDLKQRNKDDERKSELCEQHGIILVEIPYNIEYEKMAEYIIKQCKFLGVAVPELDEMPDYKLLNAYSPEALKELQETAASKGGVSVFPNST